MTKHEYNASEKVYKNVNFYNIYADYLLGNSYAFCITAGNEFFFHGLVNTNF